MYQKTGFLDDSFEARGGFVFLDETPSLNASQEQGQTTDEEEDADEDRAASITKRDPMLDPLLACMPGLQMADADMEKFLQVRLSDVVASCVLN